MNSGPDNLARRVAELRELLDVHRSSPTTFRARSASRSLPFVFGGQVAAQALAAAYHVVPEPRDVHSLHAYFLAPGDPSVDLLLAVTTLREGRSFSTVRVDVTQHDGRNIFAMMASFHIRESGVEHSLDQPDVPDPETLPELSHWLAKHRDRLPAWWSGGQPIDLRYAHEPPHVNPPAQAGASRQSVWLRAYDSLPRERGLHECVLTYASDMNLLDPVLLRHGLSWYGGHVRAASLDHSIWFHDQFRADEWLLYDQTTPVARHGRIHARGEFFQRGRVVAAASQEGLLRIIPEGGYVLSRSFRS